eukprot:gene37937-51235_t
MSKIEFSDIPSKSVISSCTCHVFVTAAEKSTISTTPCRACALKNLSEITDACSPVAKNDDGEEDITFADEPLDEAEAAYPPNFPLRKGNFYDVSVDSSDPGLDVEHSSFDALTDSEPHDDLFSPPSHSNRKNDQFLDDFFHKQAEKFQKIRLGD